MVLMLLRTRLSVFSMTAPFLNALISALFYAAESCLALKLTSNHSDGLQQIHLESIGWVPVLCDQKTNSGGWTVLQRRTRPFVRVNFDRNWTDYEAGFGNIQEGNFWLGNKMIHMLMKTPRFLRIELRTDKNENGFAEYSDVKVNGLASKYRLRMASPNGYRGSIGDCGGSSSWQYFTTNIRTRIMTNSLTSTVLWKMVLAGGTRIVDVEISIKKRDRSGIPGPRKAISSSARWRYVEQLGSV